MGEGGGGQVRGEGGGDVGGGDGGGGEGVGLGARGGGQSASRVLAGACTCVRHAICRMHSIACSGVRLVVGPAGCGAAVGRADAPAGRAEADSSPPPTDAAAGRSVLDKGDPQHHVARRASKAWHARVALAHRLDREGRAFPSARHPTRKVKVAARARVVWVVSALAALLHPGKVGAHQHVIKGLLRLRDLACEHLLDRQLEGRLLAARLLEHLLELLFALGRHAAELPAERRRRRQRPPPASAAAASSSATAPGASSSMSRRNSISSGPISPISPLGSPLRCACSTTRCATSSARALLRERGCPPSVAMGASARADAESSARYGASSSASAQRALFHSSISDLASMLARDSSDGSTSPLRCAASRKRAG